MSGLLLLKLLYAWLLPPGLFLLLALIVLCLSYKTKKKSWFLLVFIVIYALSIRSVSNGLIKPLENYYIQPDETELHSAQAIVLLGGGSYGGVKDFDGEGQVTGSAANRLLMALRLHKALYLPIIMSGGQVYSYSASEADVEYRLLKACGVEEKYLIVDSQSRNTAENAKYTKQICAQRNFDKVILVTSAFHMPRSVMLFEREGVDVIPYPTDYQTNKDTVLDAFAFVPSIGNLYNTTVAMKEYMGIMAVKIGVQ